jgi:hypothetical protein
MLALLSELYGDTRSARTADAPEPPAAVPDGSGELDAARVQGTPKEATIRRAVEIHAEDAAEDHLRRLGWTVKRVGAQKLG